MRAIPSPHGRTSLVKTSVTIGKGRAMARETWRWMEANEGSFMAVLRYVQGLKARGVKGRLRDRVAIFCADNGIEVGENGRLFTNGTFAGIVRYMVLLDPSLDGGPVVMNDSYIDCYGLLPVSWLPEIGE